MHFQEGTVAEFTTLKVTLFRFQLKAKDPLFLPAYKGSALRGGFGQVFRRIACLGSDRNLGQCLLGARCPYHYIFETPPPANSVVLNKIPTVPQPFVIEPPLSEKRVYERGEDLTFHLILIGKALDYFPYFIYSFEELGRVGLGRGKGTYTLETVSWCDAADNAVPLYTSTNKLLVDSYRPLTIAELSSPTVVSTLTLTLLTPMRLKYENQLAADCEFHVLFRNLMRRFALLNYFHCDGEFPPDRQDFVEQARAIRTATKNLRWHDWERYSNRTKKRIKLGGLVGEITYCGELTPFLPCLRLGMYTHVGKGTTFGLGQYQLRVTSDETLGNSLTAETGERSI